VLSVADMRLCQIAATLIDPGRLIVLDEPTAVLSDADAEVLLHRLELLREAGTSILYVSHRLGEVQRLADRITILRDGRPVGTFARGELDRAAMLQLMARKQGADDPTDAAGAAPQTSGEPLLSVRGLTLRGVFADVSFDVRPGQVVGIAGIQGSGHGRLMDAIAGARPVDGGSVSVAGQELEPGSLRSGLRAGLRVVPEERRERGIVAKRSVRENLAIGFGSAVASRFVRRPRAERAFGRLAIADFDIRAASQEVAAATLSGGNQQKVVIARVLAAAPKVMLLSEPTQGIDVRAKAEILRILRHSARERGMAVVLASCEFEELLDFTDVIHVMRLGRLTATFTTTVTTYAAILEAAVP
jgi:ABC-type sugar transport system ATPase subunit